MQLAAFHMNAMAPWALFVIIGGALAVACRIALAYRRGGLAALCVALILALGGGMYYWYDLIQTSSNARDARVKAVLADSPVKFIGFRDEDTERIRVEAQVGKGTSKPCKKGEETCVPCQATFDVNLGQSGDEWPLRRDSGRFPSEGCDLDDVGSDHLMGEGSQKLYLNQIFIDPYRNK